MVNKNGLVSHLCPSDDHVESIILSFLSISKVIWTFFSHCMLSALQYTIAVTFYVSSIKTQEYENQSYETMNQNNGNKLAIEMELNPKRKLKC